MSLLKSLLLMNVLNDLTSAQLPAIKKHQKRCNCDVIKDVCTLYFSTTCQLAAPKKIQELNT